MPGGSGYRPTVTTTPDEPQPDPEVVPSGDPIPTDPIPTDTSPDDPGTDPTPQII